MAFGPTEMQDEAGPRELDEACGGESMACSSVTPCFHKRINIRN
jgi:hypothetical protein